MQTHLYTFYRLQVFCIQDGTRNLHRINGSTCREGISEVTHWVAFVIIHNRIREIDGISGSLLQRIKQLSYHLFANNLYFRLFQLRRRNNHLFRCFFQFDEFVKLQFKLLVLYIYRTQRRSTPHKLRRHFIVRATIGSSHAGT